MVTLGIIASLLSPLIQQMVKLRGKWWRKKRMNGYMIGKRTPRWCFLSKATYKYSKTWSSPHLTANLTFVHHPSSAYRFIELDIIGLQLVIPFPVLLSVLWFLPSKLTDLNLHRWSKLSTSPFFVVFALWEFEYILLIIPWFWLDMSSSSAFSFLTIKWTYL